MVRLWYGGNLTPFCDSGFAVEANLLPVKENQPVHDFAIAATFVMMVLSPVFVTLFYRDGEELGPM